MHIRQTIVAAAVAVGESFVVESQQLQNRCLQIVDVDSIFDRGQSKLVG